MCLDCLIHGHKYELIKEINVYEHENDKFPVKNIYVWQCQKCGKVKKKTIE